MLHVVQVVVHKENEQQPSTFVFNGRWLTCTRMLQSDPHPVDSPIRMKEPALQVVEWSWCTIDKSEVVEVV